MQIYSITNRYTFSGKEKQTVKDLGWLDFTARMLSDSEIPLFTTQDPLAEKYYSVSPYVYCENNPVNFIDPDGRQVVGVTKDDALKVQQDLNTIFAGDQFEKFRGLLTLDKKGKTFNSISSEALAGAIEGMNLSTDQLALVNEVAGVINSKDVHKVEFVSIDGSVSREGTSAFKTHLDKTQEGAGDMISPSSRMPGETMNAVSGGGINIPTKKGSHSVIIEGTGVNHDGGRAVTTGHEVIGHGVASANRATPVENNTRAIRVDNLIRRVMGITTYRNEHGGAKIVNPYALP
jgi:RHS repeat-associated protein